MNDPDTKEADAFFWAYSQLSNNGNVATLVTIFEQVTQDETEDAATLSKMQTLSKEILEDKEYFNIGEEGKITRTPGTAGAAGLPGSKSSPPIPAVIPTATLYQVIGGDGALEQLQQEWVNWRNDAELELIRDKGDPKPAREEATKCKTKIDQLNAKRRTLQTKLTQINALARKLHPAPGSWDKDDIEDWSKTFTPDFFENTIPDYTLTDIELGDKTHSILEWLEDEKLRDTQERITRRFRMAGEGQPPASLVLDDLIRTYFGPRLAGASTGEQEQFYREMREILLSAEHGHAAGHSGATAGHATGAHAAPQTPSASHGGGHGTKPPGRSWKELFFGK
ncbi:MAG TPA: hypothetical protein VJB60_03440 [Candidatus Peribacterales bacterium]|nr:hypothetical protein [Candidatus Peribacterales bacterium]